MEELETAGWKKAKDKSANEVYFIFTPKRKKNIYFIKVTDVDIKSVFNLVDIDKSGTVSRTVSILVQTIEKNSQTFTTIAFKLNFSSF